MKSSSDAPASFHPHARCCSPWILRTLLPSALDDLRTVNTDLGFWFHSDEFGHVDVIVTCRSYFGQCMLPSALLGPVLRSVYCCTSSNQVMGRRYIVSLVLASSPVTGEAVCQPTWHVHEEITFAKHCILHMCGRLVTWLHCITPSAIRVAYQVHHATNISHTGRAEVASHEDPLCAVCSLHSNHRVVSLGLCLL